MNVDNQQMILEMNFLGTSLFEKFNLPKNWKEQITDIFDYLSSNNIEYPEFNLKNIVVINETVLFPLHRKNTLEKRKILNQMFERF